VITQTYDTYKSHFFLQNREHGKLKKKVREGRSDRGEGSTYRQLLYEKGGKAVSHLKGTDADLGEKGVFKTREYPVDSDKWVL